MKKIKLFFWFDMHGFFVIITDCHNIFSLIFALFTAQITGTKSTCQLIWYQLVTVTVKIKVFSTIA